MRQQLEFLADHLAAAERENQHLSNALQEGGLKYLQEIQRLNEKCGKCDAQNKRAAFLEGENVQLRELLQQCGKQATSRQTLRDQLQGKTDAYERVKRERDVLARRVHETSAELEDARGQARDALRLTRQAEKEKTSLYRRVSRQEKELMELLHRMSDFSEMQRPRPASPPAQQVGSKGVHRCEIRKLGADCLCTTVLCKINLTW